MKVIGQFRDLDDADRFVWLRGFRGMPERAHGLARFYGGPVWQAHRAAANATMIDSDDVLLLRPARPDSAFTLDHERPPRHLASTRERGIVEAVVMSLEATAAETGIVPFFERVIAPTVRTRGGSILAYFVTEASENTFPSLPIREGEDVFVWFAGFHERTIQRRGEDPDTDRAVAEAPGLRDLQKILRLAPTARSVLDGRSPASRADALLPKNTRRDERR